MKACFVLTLVRILLTFSGLALLTGCWPDGPEGKSELAAQGIYHGTFEPGGGHIVLGSIHHGGSLWSRQPLARKFAWNHRSNEFSEILHTAYSANGEYVLTADYHTLTLWNATSGESIAYWSAPARVAAVDLSADGQLALLGLNNNRAVLFDVVNGGILREFLHDGPVLSVSLSDDAHLALTGSEDMTARLWSIDEDRLVQRYELPNQVTLVALKGDGSQAFLAPAREQAEVWDVATQLRLHRFATENHRIYRARFQSDESLLLGTTHRRVLQYDLGSAELNGQWAIGSFWHVGGRSTTVLDMTWANDRLWALGSDGYLYSF